VVVDDNGVVSRGELEKLGDFFFLTPSAVWDKKEKKRQMRQAWIIDYTRKSTISGPRQDPKQ